MTLGQLRSGWSIGVLDARTGREEARFRDDAGDHRMLVEPTTNFFVGRLKRDLRGGSLGVESLKTTMAQSHKGV